MQLMAFSSFIEDTPVAMLSEGLQMNCFGMVRVRTGLTIYRESSIEIHRGFN
jgi:hypothetical protein